jgi:hypothetical protein
VRERSREVRLIEITGFMNGVEDGRALPQEIRGVPGALDLPDGAMRQPGRAEKVPLSRSY